jgi:acyl dehydratase
MTIEEIFWNDIAEGDELPGQSRHMTPTAIVSTAIATRDFAKVHHDVEQARKEGAKDIFLNILSTGGLVGKYVTDWSGPTSKIRKLDISLGATVFPGDTLVSQGKVTKKYQEGDECLVNVEYALTVDAGPHAWGTVILSLPQKQ